jgi:gliding motility-associated lipoprotein GldH
VVKTVRVLPKEIAQANPKTPHAQKMARRLSKWSLLLWIWAFSSCQEAPLVQSVYSFHHDDWYADSAIVVDVNVTDSLAVYRVEFQVRHHAEYPYSNLYLFREIRSESQTEYQDTVEIRLSDAQGNWYGTGIGALKTLVLPYKQAGLRFPKTGMYRFRFQHGMRDQPLHGIRDFALTIEKEDLSTE